MKNDISEVKLKCLKIRSDTDTVKVAQMKTDKQVKSLKTLIDNIQGVTETLQLDIDQMHENFQTKVDLLANLGDELDRLDRTGRPPWEYLDCPKRSMNIATTRNTLWQKKYWKSHVTTKIGHQMIYKALLE